MLGLLIFCNGSISHNWPQIISDFNKIDHYLMLIALSWKMWHVHIVSRLFAFETALKTLKTYNLWFRLTVKVQGVSWTYLRTGARHTQRIVYWWNVNNPLICSCQSELPVYIDKTQRLWSKWCLFWQQNVASLVEFGTNISHCSRISLWWNACWLNHTFCQI